MISIVIPLYNKEKQIANTLKSVLAQTYTNFEIVVVNDGSTDDSVAVVASINDNRIRLIHQENAGVSAARNHGIAEAKGEFIALLDADDEWKPDYLATQMHLAEKYPQCDVFATNYEFRNEFSKVTPTIIRRLPFASADGILSNYFEVASNSNPPLWTSAVIARKSAFESIGGFPIGIRSGEDLLTWARLACKYQIALTREAKAIYYTPTTGITRKESADLTSTNDAVGIALQNLMSTYQNIDIKPYIAFWYKMKGIVNLKYYNRSAAIKCAIKSIRYNVKSYKSWAIIVLTFFPKRVIYSCIPK
jgi:glycosyltransferase involved in cell wall biosynthesis